MFDVSAACSLRERPEAVSLTPPFFFEPVCTENYIRIV
jgi:hypothetical protein